MQLLFLDLETMGLSPDYAPILEIAAIAVDTEGPNGAWQTLAAFHEYINPMRPIPYEITAINGISNATVSGCRTEKVVLQNFAQWIIGNGFTELRPVAHNGKFDFRFLVGRSGVTYSGTEDLFVDLQSRLVDTLPLARKMIKNGKIRTRENKAKQEYLAESFGIQYGAHNAMEDTKCLVRITKKMKELDGGIF